MAGRPDAIERTPRNRRRGGASSSRGGKSLLPVGVVEVTGEFRRGDLVDCVSKASGRVIARGLVNYSSMEAATIAGKSSTLIETLLGYIDEPELIHRDNLALL